LFLYYKKEAGNTLGDTAPTFDNLDGNGVDSKDTGVKMKLKAFVQHWK